MPTKSDLIKSRKRVKDHGEVYTPPHIVKDMCDLLPTEMWETPFKTFLEPCCGNGNFLVEILDRKYKVCQNAKDGLKALASVVGVDVLPDNCAETKARLLKQFCERFEPSEAVILLASGILENNIICGDSLKIMKEWEEEHEAVKAIASR